MLYTIGILALGVFIGQEYKEVPSIKKIVTNTFSQIKSLEKKEDDPKRYSFWWFLE